MWLLHSIIAGSPDRRIAGSPDRRIAGSPDRRIAGSPDRRIAGSPDRRIAGSPDRRIAGSPDRRIAGSPDRRIAGSPDRQARNRNLLNLQPSPPANRRFIARQLPSSNDHIYVAHGGGITASPVPLFVHGVIAFGRNNGRLATLPASERTSYTANPSWHFFDPNRPDFA